MNYRVLALLGALLISACAPDSNKQPATETTPITTETEPPQPSLRAQLRDIPSLGSAIGIYRYAMTDTFNEASPGAAVIAMWAAIHNAKYGAFSSLPMTKAALVLKDSDEERGNGLCSSGTIIEIAAQTADDMKFYEGGMFSDSGQIYRFLAVGSTGELVAESRATFCGVVIGRQDYSNSMGGSAHAIYLVGMFKLPENQ